MCKGGSNLFASVRSLPQIFPSIMHKDTWCTCPAPGCEGCTPGYAQAKRNPYGDCYQNRAFARRYGDCLCTNCGPIYDRWVLQQRADAAPAPAQQACSGPSPAQFINPG